jgi:antitoxin (DNA-binding transcriptional repressor) of toxin-antitoxin stability system
MIEVTGAEAKQRLPELLSAAEEGEIVTIRNDNGRTFTLVVQLPASIFDPDWLGYPHAGSAKGLIKVHDDFGKPLPELKEYSE